MKKLILVYGLIGGAIISAMMLITMPMYKSGTMNFENGHLTGYTTMVIALSVIFVAVKSYRDKQPGGAITFWKGLQIGLLISLIASAMYALTWEYIYADMGSEFMSKMTEHQVTELKTSGASEADIEKVRADMAEFAASYDSFFVRFPFTLFVEMFPVGIIISLISAALLRKKEFLPATEPA